MSRQRIAQIRFTAHTLQVLVCELDDRERQGPDAELVMTSHGVRRVGLGCTPAGPDPTRRASWRR